MGASAMSFLQLDLSLTESLPPEKYHHGYGQNEQVLMADF